jgi:hypothetical protein
MSQAKSKLTTTARIRFPNEFLAELDSWAAAHDLPRSVAVRVLILRGLMPAHVVPDFAEAAG